jgi:phosphate uptake regulator
MYLKYLDSLTSARIPVRCLTNDFSIVRYLERLADHATYVGEAIVYIETGDKVLLR